MVGQSRIIDSITKYNNHNFPRSIILEGDYGCGKHTLTQIISSKLNIDILTLDDISLDSINNINLSSIPYIYLINGDNLNPKQQNILLKTIEEPLNNSYFIILTTDQKLLLNTLKNRCIIFKFDDYKKEDLIDFIPNKYKNDSILLNICNTPGKLLKLNNIDFDSLYAFGVKFVSKLKLASLANVLTISNKINYKDDFTKFDLNLLIDIIIYISYNSYIKENNRDFPIIYNETVKLKSKLKNKLFNQEQLFLNYLIELWCKLKLN